VQKRKSETITSIFKSTKRHSSLKKMCLLEEEMNGAGNDYNAFSNWYLTFAYGNYRVTLSEMQ
jgi:hypothetical protein|tara:strand:- start:15 stop:203 length:189 start_codon:yes stop_codon:yes gene_type:complete